MLKPRLQKFHEKIVCEDFILLYNFKNISQLPTFERAILNSTSNKFLSEKFSLLQCFSTIFLNTGQRPTNTRAHKSIALFNIRQGNLLGLKVTLRKSHLYNTLEKLLIFVVPKLLFDWKGVYTTASPSLNNGSKSLKSGSKVLSSSVISSPRLESSNENQFTRRTKKSNFVISSKNTTYFPEISELLLFFNSVTGFSFDCLTSVPVLSKKRKNSASAKQKQFISAFQYPINKLYKI